MSQIGWFYLRNSANMSVLLMYQFRRDDDALAWSGTYALLNEVVQFLFGTRHYVSLASHVVQSPEDFQKVYVQGDGCTWNMSFALEIETSSLLSTAHIFCCTF